MVKFSEESIREPLSKEEIKKRLEPVIDRYGIVFDDEFVFIHIPEHIGIRYDSIIDIEEDEHLVAIVVSPEYVKVSLWKTSTIQHTGMYGKGIKFYEKPY